MQTLNLASAPGVDLAVRRYETLAEPAATVVIGGAMGVRQAYYEPFAQWLATQGYRVWTFDYRGSGDSWPADRSLRHCDADLMDWAHDYETVIAHAKAELPKAPLFLLGHSLGAQLPGLLRDPSQVNGLLSVAAGSGYWRDNAAALRRTVLYFWHVLVPAATKLWGYFPGRRLRKVGDLPAGVILQWRRWCLNPDYSLGVEGESVRQRYASVRFPVLGWSMTDDELMTLRGTRALVGWYANAPQAVERIEPKDAAVRRIGHFGFFRDGFRDTLWPRTLAVFERWSAVTHTTA